MSQTEPLFRMHNVGVIIPVREKSVVRVEQSEWQYKQHVIDKTTLRDKPDVFEALFGDIDKTPEYAVRKLLAAILLTHVKDYLFGGAPRHKSRRNMRNARSRQKAAEQFIFNKSARDDEDPLSFASICTTLGVAPDYARRGLIARRKEGIFALLKRLREANSMRDEQYFDT